MCSKALGDYLARHQVVSLRSRPYTPQHNPWIEHGNRDIKAETGLGKGVIIHDEAYSARLVLEAIHRLDGARPRASRGMLTANAVDAALPRLYTVSDRARFYRAACAAREEAVLHVQRTPDRITAAREAVLDTLEDFGYISRSIGGSPRPAPNRKYFPCHYTEEEGRFEASG
jgi:hypothetical protein